MLIVWCEKDENKLKGAGIWPIFKTNKIIILVLFMQISVHLIDINSEQLWIK